MVCGLLKPACLDFKMSNCQHNYCFILCDLHLAFFVNQFFYRFTGALACRTKENVVKSFSTYAITYYCESTSHKVVLESLWLSPEQVYPRNPHYLEIPVFLTSSLSIPSPLSAADLIPTRAATFLPAFKGTLSHPH